MDSVPAEKGGRGAIEQDRHCNTVRMMPGPHGIPKPTRIPTLGPPRTRQGSRHREKQGPRARFWYAALRAEHRAQLEPIEEDEYSDLSPLTREMHEHLYGESIAAFGLSSMRRKKKVARIYTKDRLHNRFLLAICLALP